MIIRVLTRIAGLILFVSVAGAVSAPAYAADTYQADLFSNVEMSADGAYGGYWTGHAKFDADLDAQAKGLVVQDHHFPVTKQAANRWSATRHTQHVVETTPLDTYVWDCANVGQAKGAPGQVTFSRKDDETGTLTFVAADSASYTRSCTGFSSFTDTIAVSYKPLQVSIDVPLDKLGGGGVTKQFDIPLNCPSLMAFQDCTSHWQGNVGIERVAGDGSDTEAPPKPQPKPIKKATGKLLPRAKGAKVTVTCATACKGKISAYAVAQKRAAEQKLGSKGFSATPAGPKKVEILFGGKGARTARNRGAVIIDIKAAPKAGGPSQTKSLRLTVGR